MTAALFEITASADASARVEPVFARHETFHPRYGWLKKGFDAAASCPDIFLRPDATTLLGVGKNMVRAIRYWCSAYKVLDERPDPERPRLRNAFPSEFGSRLLGDRGWDPYLEDTGSLWLLHWRLFGPPCIAPTWFASFNALPALEFTADSLTMHVQAYCDAQDGWPATAPNSIKKDVRCFLRMFASATSGRDLSEDSIDSPFGELGLVNPVAGEGRHYRFAIGPKAALPDEILAYACLDFAADAGATAMISVSHLAHAAGGPGATFKLTEAALAEALERCFSANEGAMIADVGGSPQLVFAKPPGEVAQHLLDAHYSVRSKRSKSTVAA
jgi:hypothetical protein